MAASITAELGRCDQDHGGHKVKNIRHLIPTEKACHPALAVPREPVHRGPCLLNNAFFPSTRSFPQAYKSKVCTDKNLKNISLNKILPSHIKVQDWIDPSVKRLRQLWCCCSHHTASIAKVTPWSRMAAQAPATTSTSRQQKGKRTASVQLLRKLLEIPLKMSAYKSLAKLGHRDTLCCSGSSEVYTLSWLVSYWDKNKTILFLQWEVVYWVMTSNLCHRNLTAIPAS